MSSSKEQAIRELAYKKWLEAGAPAGNDGVEFWTAAEKEIGQSNPTTCGEAEGCGDDDSEKD